MSHGRPPIQRRSFLRGVAGIVGAGAVWKFSGETALAQIPFEDERETLMIGDEAHGLALSQGRMLGGKSYKNEYPRLAFDKNGKLWLAWISERETNGEQLYLTTYENDQFGAEIQISDGRGLDGKLGIVGQPQIVAHDKGLAAVWAEKGPESWMIKARLIDETGAPTTPVISLNEEVGVHQNPAVTADVDPENGGQRIGVVWECKIGEHFEIVGQMIKLSGELSETMRVSNTPDRDCRRPRVAIGKSAAYVVWDRVDGPGGPNIILQEFVAETPSRNLTVTQHPAANIAADITIDKDGLVWIAWQSNRKDAHEWDIPRWLYLRAYDPEKGDFLQPVGEMPSKNLDRPGQIQSFEFARVIAAPGGGVVVTGRPSHNFCLQKYDGNGWSPLYRLPQDGWGGRGQYLEGAYDADGALWVVRRDLQTNVLQKITGLPTSSEKPRVEPIVRTMMEPLPLQNIQKAPDRWAPLEDLEGIDESLNTYYGDVHGHTWLSDGVGDIDEWYWTRRDYYEDDFASLTDHDTFVGKSILPTEWESIKAITEHFNEDGKFATLFGQEYTTARYPKGIGHKCIYSTNQAIPLFDHMDEPTKTSPLLNDHVREWGAIMAPHHVAWTGTDWENADNDIQTMVEIVSNHGRHEFMGNRPIPHRGGKKGHFVQDALARGLKFGIIGGSDSHGLIWHHMMAYKRDCNRTGLACVLAPDLSRQSIFDAMKKRRIFGTTGIKPRLDFRVNGHLMGEEITVGESRVTISVKVSARNDLKWLTVVKNNQDWHEYGGEGFESRYTLIDEDLTPGVSFYYLRVEFEGEEMAWSSPIWVNYKG